MCPRHRRVETQTAKVRHMPDMVQIGNEITGGMLWPLGKCSDTPLGFASLAVLLKAGMAGVRAGANEHTPQIMIHIDRGGDWRGTQWFFDALHAQGVLDYDVMGLSYYPFFHGPPDGLRKTLLNAAARYGKPLLVAEAGYPYAGTWPEKGMTYPATPEGQAKFLADLVRMVRDMPGGLGQGVVYWAPEWLRIDGLGSSWDERTLFDRTGKALPGLAALGGNAVLETP